MKYENIKPGIFISRPNRFTANIEIDGNTEVCHVKNTGRCAELLIPGATVYVQKCSNPDRKTKYDLICVQKGETLINMDSQAPNKIFHEWVRKGGFFKNITYIKPEFTFKSSRFDFYIEADGRKILIEIKGVTLEKDGLSAFPDAPTLRGIKHINELRESVSEGYEAYIFFIIQMKNVHTLVPNRKTHSDFADALSEAEKEGVGIFALDCNITPDSAVADKFIEVNLKGGGYFG